MKGFECPAPSIIYDYLSGDLDKDFEIAITQHLDSCPACEDQVTKIEDSAGFKMGLEKLLLHNDLIDDDCIPPLDPINLAVTHIESVNRDSTDAEEEFFNSLHFPNYRILKMIGRGGMGVVFEAEQISTRRSVALKIIDPAFDRFYSPERRTTNRYRFGVEIATAARIDHANVVTVYEGGEESNCQFCAMQLVNGPSLAEMIGDGLDVELAAEYIRQAALGVAAAHAIGVIHRDIKPQNILINPDLSQAKVSDFGLAKFVETSHEPAITRAESVFGTLDYISPEQLNDSSTVSEAADIYSLGATLYFCLVGRAPFRCKSASQQVKQIMELEPVEPINLVEGLHPDLNAICMKCLEKKPANRYASAGELAEDIQRYFTNIPTKARPSNLWNRTWKLCLRNKAISALVSVVFVLVLTGIIAGSFSYTKVLEINRKLAQTNTKLMLLNHENSAVNAKLSTAIEHEKDLRQKTEQAVQIGQRAIKNFYFDVADSSDFLGNKDGMQPYRLQLLELAMTQFNDLSKLGDTPKLKYFSLMSQVNFGDLQVRMGEYEAATETFGRIENTLAKIEPALLDQADFKKLKATVLLSQGTVCLKQDRLQDAADKLSLSFAKFSTLSAQDYSLINQGNMVSIGSLYAVTLHRLRQYDQAMSVFNQCERAAKGLASELESYNQAELNLTESEYVNLHCCVLQFFGSYWYANQHTCGSGFIREQSRWMEVLEGLELENMRTEIRQQRAGFYNDFAVCLQNSAPSRSLHFREKAVNEYGKLFKNNEEVPHLRFSYAMSLRNLATCFCKFNRFEDAERALLQAEGLISGFSELDQQSIRLKKGVALIHDALSRYYFQLGDLDKCLGSMKSKLAVHQGILKTSKQVYEARSLVAKSLEELSQIEYARNEYWKSLASYFKALAVYGSMGQEELEQQIIRSRDLLFKIAKGILVPIFPVHESPNSQ